MHKDFAFRTGVYPDKGRMVQKRIALEDIENSREYYPELCILPVHSSS